MARPNSGGQFRYLESWLFAVIRLARPTVFHFNPGHERDHDYYLDVGEYLPGAAAWRSEDHYLDIEVRTGRGRTGRRRRAAGRGPPRPVELARCPNRAVLRAIHAIEGLARNDYDLTRWLSANGMALDLGTPAADRWVTQSASVPVSAPLPRRWPIRRRHPSRHPQFFRAIRRVISPTCPQRVPTQTALRPQPEPRGRLGQKLRRHRKTENGLRSRLSSTTRPAPTTHDFRLEIGGVLGVLGEYQGAVHQPEGQADGARRTEDHRWHMRHSRA